jgi:hypothetical protein
MIFLDELPIVRTIRSINLLSGIVILFKIKLNRIVCGERFYNVKGIQYVC